MPKRKAPPVSFSYPDALNFPLPQTYETGRGNGIKIHSYHYEELETVKVDFVFPIGSFDDDVPGETLLSSKCLLSGTSRLSAEELNETIATYGAFIDISSSYDFTIFTLYCLSKHFTALLPLVKDVVSSSLLPAHEVDLQRSILSSHLRTELKKSSVLASRHLRSSLFGSMGYGKSVTPSTLKEITNTKVKRWYHSKLVPSDIFITGHVPSSSLNLVIDLFKEVSTQDSAAHSPDVYEADPEYKDIILKDAVQTSIRFGKTTIKKSHDDYPSLVVVNHLLGGFFGSRLMSNLREEKGLTYGIYSSINSLKYDSYMAIGCDVKSSEKELAIASIYDELHALTAKEVSKQELEIVKRHLIGRLQNELSSATAITSKFKSLYLHGLDLGYYDTFFRKIKMINNHDVHAIAARYLNPESFVSLSVGG